MTGCCRHAATHPAESDDVRAATGRTAGTSLPVASPRGDVIEPCTVCGATRYRQHYTEPDVVSCDACGHVRVPVMPTEAEVRAIYEGEYAPGQSFDRFYAGLADVRVAEAVERLDHVARFGRGRRLLDIGAGAGFFVESAAGRGWDAEGVEVSRNAVELGRARGVPIRHGPVEDLHTDSLYDVVTLWAVVEHLVDPRRILQKAHDLLAPGGIVVVETGDASARDAVRDGPRWRMFFIPGHLHFFNSRNLDRLLRSVGFTLLDSRLDKWVEHALMQGGAEDSVLTVDRLLPRRAVTVASRVKCRVNHWAGGLGFGDVTIKVARRAGE